MTQFSNRQIGILDQMRRPTWALLSIFVFLCGQVVLPALTSEAEAQQVHHAHNPLSKGNHTSATPAWGIKSLSQFHVGKIKPSAAPACKNCEVTTQALNLTHVPSEKELRMAGQLGGALNPIGNADVNKLTAKLNQELAAAGIDPQEADAPSSTPAGKLQLVKKEKIKRLQDIDLSFGAAIQEWNKHHYSKAAGMFRQHLQDYPDSPWAGEVTLHLACDDTYNGRFSDAQSKLQDLLQNTTDQRPTAAALSSGDNAKTGAAANAPAGEDPSVGSYEIHQKAKLRWADLNLSLGRFADANPQMADILRTDTDWRRLTWTRNWFHMADILKHDKRMASCGPQALAALMQDMRKEKAAKQIAMLQPPREKGFSMQELAQISAKNGVKLVGLQANSTTSLDNLPTPFIVHYNFVGMDHTTSDFDLPATNLQGFDSTLTSHASNSVSHKHTLRAPFRLTDQQIGHYLVAQKVDAVHQIVHLYDPLEKRYYTLTYAQLSREWSGKVLAVAKLMKEDSDIALTATERSRSAANSGTRLAILPESVLKSTFGGCCGHPHQESGLGNPGGNSAPAAPTPGCGDGKGAPVWRFDMVSMNMYLTDTPLWYSSAVGPDVNIKLSYNSDDAQTQASPVGEKWVLNYHSDLVEDTTTGGGVVQVTMPDGRQDAYTPDGAGGYIAPPGVFNKLVKTGDTHYEITFPDGGKYVYDIPSGTSSLQPFLIQVVDRWGKALTMGYQDQGSNTNLTTITDALGRVTHLDYDANGRVIQVTDPFERQASFLYDTYGNLVQCTDMEGQAFQYTYDAEHVISQLATSAGNWNFYKEGPDGVVIFGISGPGGPMWENVRWTVTDPLGQKAEYFYDGYNGVQCWYVSPNNYQEWTPDLGNASPSVPKLMCYEGSVNGVGEITDAVAPTGETSHTDYDATSTLPVARTDARGKITHYAYNSMGMPTSVTDPLGHTTAVTYAANGVDATSVTDAQSNTVMTTTYNSYHQPLTVTDKDNNTTTFTYTNWGAPDTVTDASGIVTTYNYNSLGQVTSIDRDGKTLASYTYDTIGNVATSTDANGVTLSYQYNNLGHLTKVTYPDSTSEETIYVCCNLPGMVKDRSGKITYYDYDALKRLIRVQDSAGNTASYQYDTDGNLLKMLDAKGTQTFWTYDLSDRAVRKTYNDQHYQQYSYSGGLLAATRNEKGDVTQYGYDDAGKLSTILYPHMTAVTFSYDALDRLTYMTDGLGTTHYTYDDLSQLSGEDGPWANDALSYAHDVLGRETGVGINGNAVATYSYDDLSRMSGLNSIAGNFTYSYVGNSGLMNEIDLPNGAKSTFTYDALERLTQVQSLTSGSANIAKFAYTLDNRDIRTAEEKTFGTDPLRHIDYGYDTVNQLTSAVSTETPPDVNQTWAYDAMGNRTQHASTSGSNPTSTATYTANSLNQITGISTTTGSNTIESTFAYDADGNTTQVANDDNSATQYTYDDADRLSSVIYKNSSGVNVSKSTYTYDGLSRLRIITKYTWDTGTSAWVQQSQKKLLYDGMQVIQERDGSDNVIANNIWDGNIGGLEARVVYDINTPANPPQKYFYHYDGSGNVTAVTDDTQSTVASYDYDAYGNQLNASGAYALQNPWRFSTKYYDGGSGMYYYGYRFYSPGLGRWINRDPSGENGGLNLYEFGFNSPINGNDLYGLDWLNDASDFSAGWGDALTFGATGLIRNQLGVNDVVDECSGWYVGGQVAGTVNQVAILSLAGGEGAASQKLFTGGRILNYADFEGAEEAYNVIRETDDIAAIAENTGMRASRVARIKEHLFFNTHVLDDGIRLFDADPEIANAWSRLQSGTHTTEDVNLLEHEIFESRFEGIFKSTYRQAHEATLQSGRGWMPY